MSTTTTEPHIVGTEHHVCFYLVRDEDVTGISGTGIVAEGVQFSDGTATIRWRGDRRSTVNWSCMEDVQFIHGHGGKTHIQWGSAPDTYPGS